jgi:hypothetical protein
MELLEIATPIKYSISSREKTPDGTFTKRKILIQLKRNEQESL